MTILIYLLLIPCLLVSATTLPSTDKKYGNSSTVCIGNFMSMEAMSNQNQNVRASLKSLIIRVQESARLNQQNEKYSGQYWPIQTCSSRGCRGWGGEGGNKSMKSSRKRHELDHKAIVQGWLGV